MTSARSDTRSTSRRQIALVVLALVLAVLFAFPGSGLLSGWSSAEHGGIHRFHTVVWGIHTGLVLSVGLFALALRTDERVATAQQMGVAMAVMMTVFFGSVVIPNFGEPAVGIDRLVFSSMVLVLTGVVLALHPRRNELLTIGRSISKPMAAFGVIGLAVAARYALDQIQVQLATDLALDLHSAPGKEHWAEMASAALTLPLIAIVAALRTRGFRPVARTAGLGTMVFGAASALLPEHASSPGVAWGVVAVFGGALFIAVAEIEARRDGPPQDVTEPPATTRLDLESPGVTMSTQLGSYSIVVAGEPASPNRLTRPSAEYAARTLRAADVLRDASRDHLAHERNRSHRPHQALRQPRRGRRCHLLGRRRRDLRHPRSERSRQDDDRRVDRRVAPVRRWNHSRARTRPPPGS